MAALVSSRTSTICRPVAVRHPVAVRQPGASSLGLLQCPNIWPQLAVLAAPVVLSCDSLACRLCMVSSNTSTRHSSTICFMTRRWKMLPRWACLFSCTFSCAFGSKPHNYTPWRLSSPAEHCATCCPPAYFLQLYIVTRWRGEHAEGSQPCLGKLCAGPSPDTTRSSCTVQQPLLLNAEASGWRRTQHSFWGRAPPAIVAEVAILSQLDITDSIAASQFGDLHHGLGTVSASQLLHVFHRCCTIQKSPLKLSGIFLYGMCKRSQPSHPLGLSEALPNSCNLQLV